MPEPPRWFQKLLPRPMPPWLQMAAHASSLELIPKGQFTKTKVGEVGAMMVGIVTVEEGVCVQFTEWLAEHS